MPLAAATVAALLATTAPAALAAARPARPDAEALVARAVACIQASGPRQAYAAFTHGAAYKDGPLYVVVQDLAGRTLAHGANARLVGQDLAALTDLDGRPLIRQVLDLARRQGRGWSDAFSLRNAVTNGPRRHALYVQRVGDTVVSVGVPLD